MKAKFSLIAILVAASSFLTAPAKAGIFDWLFPPTKPTPGPTSLPINGGLIFLVVAGLAICIVAFVKAKARKAVKA